MVASGGQFDRSRRLTTPADYQRVFASARRSADAFLLVLARDNELDYARLGTAVARKKVPKATARNRVKRIIRESFRRHQQALAGLDLVVLVRANLSCTDNHLLFRSLEKHWNRHVRLKRGNHDAEQQ